MFKRILFVSILSLVSSKNVLASEEFSTDAGVRKVLESMTEEIFRREDQSKEQELKRQQARVLEERRAEEKRVLQDQRAKDEADRKRVVEERLAALRSAADRLFAE